MSCSVVDILQVFGGSCCLHRQVAASSATLLQYLSKCSVTPCTHCLDTDRRRPVDKVGSRYKGNFTIYRCHKMCFFEFTLKFKEKTLYLQPRCKLSTPPTHTHTPVTQELTTTTVLPTVANKTAENWFSDKQLQMSPCCSQGCRPKSHISTTRTSPVSCSASLFYIFQSDSCSVHMSEYMWQRQ